MIYLLADSDNNANPDKIIVYDPSANTWQQKASVPFDRSFAGFAAVNNKIYAVGGYKFSNDNTYATVEEYDPATNIWTVKANLLTARDGMILAVAGGKLYAISGSNDHEVLKTIEEYDPVSNIWTPKVTLPDYVSGGQAFSIDDKIYIVAWDFLIRKLAVYMFDPQANTVTEKTSTVIRWSYGAIAYKDKIYIIAGKDDSGKSKKVEVYDTATDTWTTLAPMPTWREYFGMAVVRGRIYILGGSKSYKNYMKEIEEYDTVTDTWTRKKDMPEARDSLYAPVVNDKIYIIGGSSNSNQFNDMNVLEYNPCDSGSTDNIRTLLVKKSGSGSGTVTGEGINCGSDCLQSYPAGTSVTLSVTPDTDSKFNSWENACTGSGSCTVIMDSTKVVGAEFETTVPCTDSDGGNDIYTTGTTSGIQGWNGKVGTHTDYCSGNVLVEYYCSNSKEVYSQTSPCPSGYICSNGKCGKTQCRLGSIKCVDEYSFEICEYQNDGSKDWGYRGIYPSAGSPLTRGKCGIGYYGYCGDRKCCSARNGVCSGCNGFSPQPSYCEAQSSSGGFYSNDCPKDCY